jgi:hypothetical protein
VVPGAGRAAESGHGPHGHTAECQEMRVVVHTVGHTVHEMVQDSTGLAPLAGMDCAEERWGRWAIHYGYVEH